MKTNLKPFKAVTFMVFQILQRSSLTTQVRENEVAQDVADDPGHDQDRDYSGDDDDDVDVDDYQQQIVSTSQLQPHH